MDMNAVKRFIPEIAMGAVVLGGLGFVFFMLPGTAEELQTQMKTRYSKESAARTLSNQTVVIPSIVPGQPPTEFRNTVVTADATEAKQAAMKFIKGQADAIAEMSADRNREGRVQKAGANLVPLMGDEPQQGLLPEPPMGSSSPLMFRDRYRMHFPRQTARLATGQPQYVPGMTAGLAPTDAEVKLAYDTYKKNRQDAAPKVGGQVLKQPTIQSLEAFARDYVAQRAVETKGLYVSPSAFQVFAWANEAKPPTPEQIYAGMVTMWIQDDIVDAILELNKGNSGVARNPVKRLLGIHIGAGASAVSFTDKDQTGTRSEAGTGSLFLKEGSMTAAATPGAPPPPSAAAGSGNAPVGLDYAKSMTGRVGSERYDVTHVKLAVDIEPTYLNHFIKELYSQNNGYTVLEIDLTTIDPFTTISNGYVYGSKPVVRAEILMEAVFFREWTTKIMPAGYRTALGVPAATAAAPAGGGSRGRP